MLAEPGIPGKWVWRAIDTPDRTEDAPDGTRHFIRSIAEYGGRYLRVVVNETGFLRVIATVFFDRRLRSRS